MPARKPTKLKVLEGNRGKRKLEPEKEPQFASGVRRPRWLDSYAKREWARMKPILEAQGLLTVADQAAFTAYCVAYSQMRHAAEELKKNPDAVYAEKRSHPAMTTLFNAIDKLNALSSRFGLTPSDRSRVKVSPKKQTLQDLLKADKR
jgi:P27 family predicted phage terminase small subunit